LACQACGHVYGNTGGANRTYLDLRPVETFAETTKYVSEALHADARHEHVSPPLLGAGLRNSMLRKFLDLNPADRVIDLGCGSGRALVWNRDTGAYAVGVDVSPFFAIEAEADADLVLGDLRRLPFEDGAFTKAYTLDVLEHLSKDALVEVLREGHRVLAPGGALFVYTHVRQNSRLATGVRAVNRLAERLDRAGLIDLRQEQLRKSDHLNPLDDLDDLRAVAARTGFRIARIRFYTPLVGAFVENILMRLVEQAMTRRAAARLSDLRAEGETVDRTHARRIARATAKQAIARRGPVYLGLRGLTALMKIDVALFGRIRSGPFFALLVKEPGSR
jgi:SAM-dependent methyltransferase